MDAFIWWTYQFLIHRIFWFFVIEWFKCFLKKIKFKDWWVTVQIKKIHISNIIQENRQKRELTLCSIWMDLQIYYLSGHKEPTILTWRGGYGFLLRSEFFFRTTREFEYFFFQNSTIGYMTKTESHYFFFLNQNQNIFFQYYLESEYFFRNKP